MISDAIIYLENRGLSSLADAVRELQYENNALKEKSEPLEAEQARWQHAIADKIAEFVPNVCADGCDSGDPLDWSLAEIGIALQTALETTEQTSEPTGCVDPGPVPDWFAEGCKKAGYELPVKQHWAGHIGDLCREALRQEGRGVTTMSEQEKWRPYRGLGNPQILSMTRAHALIAELEAENARLREAMEKIANDEMLDIITATDIAVQALEGGDDDE